MPGSVIDHVPRVVFGSEHYKPAYILNAHSKAYLCM